MDVSLQDHQLLQDLRVGVVVHAADSRIIFINRRATELLGLSEDQLYGSKTLDPAFRIVTKDGAQLSPAEYPVNLVIATHEPVMDCVLGIQHSLLHPPVWVMVSALPEFHASGELNQVVVSFYEISNLKNTEKALKDKAIQLQFVLEGSELGFWDWNIATGEVDRNERWAVMLGYSHAEIQHTTKQWTDFVHPEDRDRAWESINAVLEGRAPAHKLEYRMLHKDGSVRWILDQAKVMQRDAQGKATRMCGTHTDITERKSLEAALMLQAQTDYLTGIFNRRHFMESAEHEIKRAARYGYELSLLMMDVDFFKQINDQYGHKVGDSVLERLAEICKSVLRGIDIFGRMGGEEFAVLLPESNSRAAEEVAERLIHAVSNTEVLLDGGRQVQFTVSIGIASMSSINDNLDMLLSIADTALYKAKSSGRNKVCAAFISQACMGASS